MRSFASLRAAFFACCMAARSSIEVVISGRSWPKFLK
jgi:hypothetical protein